MSEFKFRKGDKVKLLDGSKAERFFGGWNPDMEDEIGRVCTIEEGAESMLNGRVNYHFREIPWVWDEEFLELVESSTDNKETEVPEIHLEDILSKVSEITIKFK